MKKILAEIQSGEFASQWIDENKTGRQKFLAMREAAHNQTRSKTVGSELRDMMPFLKKKKGSRRTCSVVTRQACRDLSQRQWPVILMKIFTFDTTLRDGTQGESISFSVDDKLIIAQKLDELGIDYIEGGWPGSQPQGQGILRARRAS